MTKQSDERTKRISADELGSFARLGVARALAARSKVSELTQEQMEQVSGGLRPVIKDDPFVLSGAHPRIPDPAEALKGGLLS